jgi:hypothetical protein
MFQSQQAFRGSIVKAVHFKIIIICIYRNPICHIQIPLDNSEITVDYLDKMKDQVIIIGDLNINVFKHESTKKTSRIIIKHVRFTSSNKYTHQDTEKDKISY